MFDLKKVYNGVYLLSFDDSYQLCMHFLRYQERYESPKFRNTNFELVDLMEWYSKEYGGGIFTYPKDWAGFNIPGVKLFEFAPNDENRYDRLMVSIGEYCRADHGNESFYVIGVQKSSNLETVKHEVAHAFYFIEPEYKAQMDRLIMELPPALRKEFVKLLTGTCYNEHVIFDEIQAYMATGLMKKMAKGKKYQKPFQELFSSYFKAIKI